MDLKILYGIGILFLAVAIITVLIKVLLLKKNYSSHSYDYFSMIFSKKDFRATKNASNESGKINSPFIKDKEIIEIVKNGMAVVNINKSMYEGVGDCDERPRWQ